MSIERERWCLGVLCALASCGRVGYEDVRTLDVSRIPDASVSAPEAGPPAPDLDAPLGHAQDAAASPKDGPTSAPLGDANDAAKQPRLCLPFTDPWTLDPPEPLTDINSNGLDMDPFVTADGLVLYFASSRDGGRDGIDMYIASRDSPSEPFADVQALPGLSSPDAELGLRLTNDGLVGFLVRPGPRMGMAEATTDIYIGRRPSRDVPWELAMFVRSDTLSTGEQDWDAFPSPDGLRVYYTINNRPAGFGFKDNVVASRGSIEEPFGPPQGIPGVNSEWHDDNPSVTQDELVIIFGRENPAMPGDRDLWYATRTTVSEPFGTPLPLPVVNSQHMEGEAVVTPHCELIFTSTRPGGRGSQDLYRSRFRMLR